jgi:hypothetical protein
MHLAGGLRTRADARPNGAFGLPLWSVATVSNQLGPLVPRTISEHAGQLASTTCTR